MRILLDGEDFDLEKKDRLDARYDTMEQAVPKAHVKKVWPLMTPAERLAIWEDARCDWAHDARDVIKHVESGRDEADRELPPREPWPV